MNPLTKIVRGERSDNHCHCTIAAIASSWLGVASFMVRIFLTNMESGTAASKASADSTEE